MNAVVVLGNDVDPVQEDRLDRLLPAPQRQRIIAEWAEIRVQDKCRTILRPSNSCSSHRSCFPYSSPKGQEIRTSHSRIAGILDFRVRSVKAASFRSANLSFLTIRCVTLPHYKMVHQEASGKSQPDCVYSVTQIWAHMARDRKARVRECPIGRVNRIDRDDVVVFAVNQHYRRPRSQLCG